MTTKTRAKAEFDPRTGLVNPNLLINGDFSVWQRGSDFTDISTSIYTADRWIMTVSGDSLDVSEGGVNAKGGNRHPYILIKPKSTNGNLGIEQRIENFRPLEGKVLTFSILVYADEVSTYDCYHGFFSPSSNNSEFVGNEIQVISEEWVRLSWTFTVPQIPEGAEYYQVSVRRKELGLSYFRLSEAKLEYGAVVTEFWANDYSVNISKCKRYYIRTPNLYGYSYGSQRRFIYAHPTNMRIAPSASDIIYTPSNLSSTTFRESTQSMVRIDGVATGSTEPTALIDFAIDVEL